MWTLGKLGNQKAAEPLADLLEDDSPKIREAVVWGLGWNGLGNRGAVDPLINALGDRTDKVREAAAWGLGKIGDQRAIDPLIDVLSDDSIKVQEAAIWALGELGDKKAILSLLKTLGKGPAPIREKAVTALDRLGEPLGHLIHDSIKGSQAARIELSRRKDSRAVASLVEALKDKEWEVRREAVLTLAGINDRGAIEALANMASNWNPYDRFYALRMLVKMKQGRFSDYLMITARILFGGPASLDYTLIAFCLLGLGAVLIFEKKEV